MTTASLPLETPRDAEAAIRRFATHPRPGHYRVREAATPEALAALEAKLGIRLPDELRAALLVHDGIRETYVGTQDLLGGTKTLSGLRRRFREQWTEIAEDLEEDAPFRFGKRYLVLGTTGGTGHDFALLDTQRRLDGAHPVLRYDLDDGEEVEGFRSFAHYLHWVFLDANDVGLKVLKKLFPERYSMTAFKRMMRGAEKVSPPISPIPG